MYVFKSKDIYHIKDFNLRVYIVENPINTKDFDFLIGKEVMIDGRKELVHTVDSFLLPIKRKGLPIGIVVKTDQYFTDISHPSDDIYTIDDFLDMVKSGYLTDYDGHGHYSDGICFNPVIYVKPSMHKEIESFPDKVTHIIWYNK